ncbi:hypothetical protein DCC81_03765 [Chitinophaga parva]|uniref:Uncharacterized protein n=1 Tax=Chitinophaga parva TaxID=2169414 RepID=A0A2T7BLW5_9BACT|nr:hypothetical protein [Chitinophaga parva]PUZ28611.1 hypothetical protein DCC81_03765 [Chitinophaga parva]
MNTFQHNAIIAIGGLGEIHLLHEQLRRLLWGQGPDYVRLLSPVCNSLAGRLASFAIMPHGFDLDSPSAQAAGRLLEEATILIGMADCQYVHVGFGIPGAAAYVLGPSV